MMFKTNTFKSRTFNKTHGVLLALLLAAIAFFAFKFYQPATSSVSPATSPQAASTPATSTQAKAALTVTTVTPALNHMQQSIAANGSIAPWQEALIGAEVSGLQLNQVLVNVGDHVKRGQLLAAFSSTTIQADIAQARASLAEAKANAAEAAGNASRARGIQDTGALSTQQVEQLMTLEAASSARVAAAEATLQAHEIKLKQTKVFAPDDGVISARAATVGAVVSPGQELFRLIRQGRLEWRAELTSSDVSDIQTGMNANLTLPNGDKMTGKVRAVSPMVDTQTRNAIVYVDLPHHASIKAGMFARGDFVLGDKEVATLPASALVQKDGFSYVMQVDKQNRIKQLKVQIGSRVGDDIEIIGLKDAMTHAFVASGAAFLADGDYVTVVAGKTSIHQ